MIYKVTVHWDNDIMTNTVFYANSYYVMDDILTIFSVKEKEIIHVPLSKLLYYESYGIKEEENYD